MSQFKIKCFLLNFYCSKEKRFLQLLYEWSMFLKIFGVEINKNQQEKAIFNGIDRFFYSFACLFEL